ncbi:FecR family protein [Pacificibacter marinus]|uniref:Fec operon regulator FecR n=1 Tax=Pacificibacter marinus TaxID=658057 RepID=A0A1Y5SPA1_9RHOB|nr:FecR domain-containing protein [Pacificibacter marinus]SEK69738.1 FecR family protein [Pacificibacter marinus]SLN45264.1 fec operon regulator FecR [Pacificibacter marinus]
MSHHIDQETLNMNANTSDTLSDQALDWIIRLNSGAALPEDHRAWAQWRAQSPAHDIAAQDAESLWQGLGPAGSAWGKSNRNKRMTRRAVLGGGAALIAAGGLNQFQILGPHLLADYQTTAAERRDLTLTDGTHVAMNAQTALSGHAKGATRGATLYRGQALFDINPQGPSPFAIKVGPHEIQSAHAVLDVERHDDTLNVAVLRGAVNVIGANAKTTLTANQLLQIKIGQSEHRIASIDAQARSAWRRGKLIFNDRSLADLTVELERYRGGRVVVMGQQLSQMRLSGVFDLADPEAILDDIAVSLGLRVTRMPMLAVIRKA